MAKKFFSSEEVGPPQQSLVSHKEVNIPEYKN